MPLALIGIFSIKNYIFSVRILRKIYVRFTFALKNHRLVNLQRRFCTKMLNLRFILIA